MRGGDQRVTRKGGINDTRQDRCGANIGGWRHFDQADLIFDASSSDSFDDKSDSLLQTLRAGGLLELHPTRQDFENTLEGPPSIVMALATEIRMWNKVQAIDKRMGPYPPLLN